MTELNGTDIHSSITFNLQKVETTQESIEELMDDQNMVHLHNGTQGMQVGSLGQEDPLGGGHGNPLQYSCLENPMDRGAWQATVHGVTKSQTQLK